jgi:quinol monooxygenase YgiN
MRRAVIVVYRPREGREAQLLEAIRDHVPMLRAENLATDRAATLLRAEDGSYLEIFEWASAGAIEAAHRNPVVQRLWERFEEVCEYRTLASLAEAEKMFPEFDPVDFEPDRS